LPLMNSDRLETIRATLLLRQQELQEQARAGAEDEKPVELDQQRVGRLSRMDAMQAQAMSSEIGRRREVELARIGSALGRIDSGDYGYCVRCEEEIGEKRLEIDPAAPLCVDCAQRSENRGR